MAELPIFDRRTRREQRANVFKARAGWMWHQGSLQRPEVMRRLVDSQQAYPAYGTETSSMNPPQSDSYVQQVYPAYVTENSSMNPPQSHGYVQQVYPAYVTESSSMNPPESHGHVQQVNRLLQTTLDSNNEALQQSLATISQQNVTVTCDWQPHGLQIPSPASPSNQGLNSSILRWTPTQSFQPVAFTTPSPCEPPTLTPTQSTAQATHPTQAPGADSTLTPTQNLQPAIHPTTAPSADSTATPKPPKASNRNFATSRAKFKAGTYSFIPKVDSLTILRWKPRSLRGPSLAITTPSEEFNVGVDTLTKENTINIATSSAGFTAGVDAVNLEGETLSLEDDTPAEQTTDIDNLVERVKNILHEHPGSTASLNDILIGPETVDQFQGRYSTRTFQLLRAITTNPWASTTIIILSDEGYESIAVTENTKTMLFIRFQQGRFPIGHWVLVRADLRAETVDYYDSVPQPREVADSWTIRTCKEVKELLNKARQFKGLNVIEFNPQVKRHYTQQQSDSSNCGPLTWMEVEITLHGPLAAVTTREARYRHLNRLYKHLQKLVSSQGQPLSEPTTKKRKSNSTIGVPKSNKIPRTAAEALPAI